VAAPAPPARANERRRMSRSQSSWTVCCYEATNTACQSRLRAYFPSNLFSQLLSRRRFQLEQFSICQPRDGSQYFSERDICVFNHVAFHRGIAVPPVAGDAT